MISLKKVSNLLAFLSIISIICFVQASQVREDLHNSMKKKSNYYSYAMLQGLDRVSDKSIKIKAQIGKNKNYFENLTFTVSKCWKAESSIASESAAFVSIYERVGSNQQRQVYSGWLFSNNSYLTNIEHGQYDLRLLGCSQE